MKILILFNHTSLNQIIQPRIVSSLKTLELPSQLKLISQDSSLSLLELHSRRSTKVVGVHHSKHARKVASWLLQAKVTRATSQICSVPLLIDFSSSSVPVTTPRRSHLFPLSHAEKISKTADD